MPADPACLISIKAWLFGLGIHLDMKAKDFIVIKRPTLAKITKHPTVEFANYERRLKSMQSVMQSIQQAYGSSSAIRAGRRSVA